MIYSLEVFLMKTWAKKIVGAAGVAALSFAVASFSCSAKENSAATVFADTRSGVSVPASGLAAAEALQESFRSVSSAVLPAVVELDVIETKTIQSTPFDDFPFFFFGIPRGSGEPREYEQQGLGSGVIVRKDGKTYYVLTNNHVAGEATEISVKLNDERTFTGKLIGKDERKDIALVSFESDDMSIPVARLGDSDDVQTGDICFSMGAPLGYYSTVTQGIVSATGRSGTAIGNVSDFIQTDAAINPGNSGGPLVNIYGEVIGINTWIASQSGGSQGIGFAIPINNVKKAIDDFIEKGEVTYGWLGVSLVEIKDEYKKELGVEGKIGAFASQIFLDSPAAKGGMQAGDYIIAMNGEPIKNTDQLVRDVGDLTVGEKVEFECIRGGESVTVSVSIEARDDDTASDNSQLWPGFIAYPITDEIREELELDKKVEGVVVTNIMPRSPAAAMRLQSGDVITAVNDTPVRSLAEFYGALESEPGSSIWFDVYSQGHTITTSRYRL